MIVWRVKGALSKFTCSLEKDGVGYRLLVTRDDGRVEAGHQCRDIADGRIRAEALRQELLAMGFTSLDE